MKKLLMYGLVLSLYVANCFSMEPQDITVELAEGKTVIITQEQLNQLQGISTTVQGFIKSSEQGVDQLGLQDVDQQSFKQILEIGSMPQDQQKSKLSPLGDNQLYKLILSSNYLSTKILLENALKEFASRSLSNLHIDQLRTKQGYEEYYKKFDFSSELMMKMVKLNQEHTTMQELRRRYIQRPTIQHQELTGHEEFVNSIAFSLDGHYFASGSSDNTVRIWNMKNLTEEPQILTGHEQFVNSVAFSRPDGRYLASGSSDNTVRIWDMNNLTEEPQILTGHENSVNSVAFSPDGRYLASGSLDRTVRIWNMNNLTEAPWVLAGHGNVVTSVAFSPDGRYLASGSGDTNVRIWDMNNLTEAPQILRGHGNTVFSVAFSPKGRYLASGSEDKMIRIWDMNNLTEEPQVLTGHGGWIRSVAFSPDDRYLASGSNDRTVRIWNMNNLTEEPQVLTGHGGWIRSVAFSSDGRYLVSSSEDKTVRIWKIEEPFFVQAIGNLTLAQQQLIVMIITGKFFPEWYQAGWYLLMPKLFRPITGKVSRAELPEHLRATFDTLPNVIKQLLIKE